MSKIPYLLAAVLLLGSGFGLAKLTTVPGANADAATDAKYPLLAPSVLADNSTDILINFVALRDDLNAKFNALTVQKSFYFQYLPDGTSIKIGADQNMVAASLIKVPLVMNLYRAAELGRINLNSTVTVTSSELDQDYGDLWKKGAGYKLTLRQAAQDALEQSDDTATHVIYDHTSNLLSYNDQSLAGLDIDQDFENGQAAITARAYSSVLQSLFYAAYLNEADSEQVLSYLTKSAETRRLTNELPKDVPVAHKNGVSNSSWVQSDCGIVYVPRRPYMICVMVGLPEAQANTFIAGVSKEVYDFVSSQ